MSTIADKLRGIYRIPITDGLGPAGGDEPDNPNEFVRHFETPPIQHRAADIIDEMEMALELAADDYSAVRSVLAKLRTLE